DKVQEFANINVANPGNQDITFCYWGTENDTVRWAYANAYKAVYPDSLSAALPEIYYIDETNTIKYATTGTQTLTQIKENLISYAGYKVAGLNKDNPSAMEFTTIDDTTVSATANGRPKVLVLGNNDGVARDTLTSFENKFPDGVDIYFVNIAGNDKDQTTEFKNTVKSNGKIVYCYDVYGRYIGLADEYLRAANLMTGQNQGYATPVICYIDAENKLQYVTQGESNGDQLLNILKSSCFYEEGQGEDVEEVQSLILQKPTKTVYLTGESLSVEGGQVGLTSDSMTALTTSMVSGFNSRQPGIQYLTVTHEGVTVQFSVIVVEVPQVTAKVGDTLSSINLPVYTYGVYSWKNSGTTLETKGNQSFEAIFTPTDIVNYSVRNGIQIQVEVTENETPVTPPSVEEKYIVTFNYGGKLDNETVEVKKGENVTQPDITTVEGFEFKGWYKEETFITPWNFESDTVTKDLTLYAKWETKSVDPGEPEDPVLPESKVITVAPIADLVYTGKALKPVVQVYDGEKLLQLNKDYKVTYKNNVNANAGAVQAGEEFNENLPSVIITGKGNYSGTLQVNFNILPIEIRDEKDVIDSGLKVNITDQLVVNTKKAVAPLKSVSFGKTLKEGQDYTFTLSCMNATDSEGQPITGRLDDGKIPAGAKGRFTMIIKFEGNYRGVATYFISVAEKTELIKNAAVTLKKEFKSIDFEAFNNGYANKMLEEGFEVKMGQTLLEPSKDYGATWANIDKIGTATLIISGSGNYKGTKAVNFKLTGKALTASKLTLENFGNLTYTGEPLAQKDLIIKYEGKPLTEGTDYIVSYTKNDKVGTAVMTITAKEGSYYQGSVKKTFKIAAADITQVKQPEAITVPYSKAGARPVAEVVLENALGQRLVNGKDYTLSYKNNKNVAEANSSNGPVVVVKGKGNYTGTLEIPFTITKADLSDLGITVKAVAYNAKKADSYAYQPAVTIKDGSKTLSSKTDYTVEYENNTQAAYKAYYLDKIEGAPKPVVKITARKVSSYTTEEPVIIELPVYRIKLTSKNVYAVISETSYTGKQATPEVELYYSADHKVIKDIKAKG
ncbi:MAG: InlB B-repeat-containing protein, partial [Lachnospiraceae bacterium]|nr:InlB B-repeat-containing protein [Lachnospiraceae bacterium]